jgi:predicted nucleotidyltransferase component of viral defense system
MKGKTPDKSILDEVAIEKGIDPAFVEKDWYVTQLIKHINEFSYPGVQLVFSGGTALSKAHRLIERFSEDIDFRVIWPELEKENGSRQKKLLSKLKNAIFDHIHQKFPIDETKKKARDTNRFFTVDIDYSTIYKKAIALRPHLQIEFTLSKMALAPLNCSVSSFVGEVTGQPAEVTTICCIDPVENAVDKLSAFIWRTADRERGTETDDPSIVRHQHDLSILHDRASKHPSFRDLARKVIEQDKGRSDKIAAMTLAKMIEHVQDKIKSDPLSREEYDRFVKSMSYAKNEQMPTYEQSFEKVLSLLKIVGAE